jgi:type IV pilus assembly protein PilE
MRRHGFSLIEVMAVVVIIGVLASIAIPLYTGHIRKARRSEAMAALQTIALYEEKGMAEFGKYGNQIYLSGDLTFLIDTTGLPDPDNDGIYEPSDFYILEVSTGPGSHFIAKARPKGAQASDNITLAINSDGQAGKINGVGWNFVEDRALWR